MSFLDSLFNMADKKDLKQFSKIADQIDAAGEKYAAMTDAREFDTCNRRFTIQRLEKP